MIDVNNRSSSTGTANLATTAEIPFSAAGDIAPNTFPSAPEAEAEQARDRVDAPAYQDQDRQEGSRRTSDVSTAVAATPTTVPAEGYGSVPSPDATSAGEGGLAFPPTRRTITTSSGKPYSSFSTHMKWMIVTLAGFAGIFSPIR